MRCKIDMVNIPVKYLILDFNKNRKQNADLQIFDLNKNLEN